MSMTAIDSTRTGLIYRNPAPHVRSLHGYFPSVVQLDDGQLLATVTVGQAFEANDVHTELLRSADRGETWQHEGRLCPPSEDGRVRTDACRITALPGGRVVAFVMRHDRTDHPDDGFTNPDTLGFVPTELNLIRSQDGGRTWGGLEPLTPPLVGPSFEMCSPVTPLSDGRWLLPTSTWRGWDGDCPNGMKMIAFVSQDEGRSWPEYVEVLSDPEDQVIYWESKIVELADGRLLAAAWAYDEAAAADRPNHYAVSEDGGRTWSPPRSTGLQGQTMTPVVLDGDRVLAVYRRMDRPGLWAQLAHLEGDTWVNDETEPLWGADTGGLTLTSDNMAQNCHVLRFGAPCLTRLDDGAVLASFWCYEDCVSNIRWFEILIS